MKKYEFVCKSELKAFLLKVIFFGLFFVFESVIIFFELKEDGFPKSDIFFWIESFVGQVLIIGAVLCVRYNALVAQYKITKDGVTNRIIKLNWNNIKECKVFFPTWKNIRYYHSEIDLLPVICMGYVKNNSIFWQSKFKSVIVPLTQRNLKLIDEYWVNKSPEMQKIIDENIGFPDYIDKWNVWWQ